MSKADLAARPWPGPGDPSERGVAEALRAEGLSPIRWSNGPGDRYGEHSHSYHKVLYCAEGGITFLVEGAEVPMKAGDRLELPPGTRHAAVVGPQGCVCYEGHR